MLPFFHSPLLVFIKKVYSPKFDTPYSISLTLTRGEYQQILAVWAMFLYSRQHKSYQGTLGTLKLILIGSRTSLGPSMDPTGAGKVGFNIWLSMAIVRVI